MTQTSLTEVYRKKSEMIMAHNDEFHKDIEEMNGEKIRFPCTRNGFCSIKTTDEIINFLGVYLCGYTNGLHMKCHDLLFKHFPDRINEYTDMLIGIFHDRHPISVDNMKVFVERGYTGHLRGNIEGCIQNGDTGNWLSVKTNLLFKFINNQDKEMVNYLIDELKMDPYVTDAQGAGWWDYSVMEEHDDHCIEHAYYHDVDLKGREKRAEEFIHWLLTDKGLKIPKDFKQVDIFKLHYEPELTWRETILDKVLAA